MAEEAVPLLWVGDSTWKLLEAGACEEWGRVASLTHVPSWLMALAAGRGLALDLGLEFEFEKIRSRKIKAGFYRMSD